MDCFQDYWNANRRNVHRDVAELFTGVGYECDDDGCTIGCAYVAETCETFRNGDIDLSSSYGINWVTYTSNSVKRSNLVAHEIGHTVGASHDRGSRDFIMFPSNGGNNRYFGPASINSFLRDQNDICITEFNEPGGPTDAPTKSPTAAPTAAPTAKTCGANEALIKLDLLTDEYGAETTWDIKNPDGNVVASGGPYSSETSFVETVCVPSNACTFTIFDHWGDGICCSVSTVKQAGFKSSATF